MPPLTPIRNHYNYPRTASQQIQPIQTNQLMKEKPEDDRRNSKVNFQLNRNDRANFQLFHLS